MKFKTISYSKVFSLGNFQNEKIGIEFELSKEDNPVEAMKYAQKYVEFMSSHKQGEIGQALFIVKNQKSYPSQDVISSKAILKEAQKLFPELIK